MLCLLPLSVVVYREVKGKLRKAQAALKQAKRKDYYKVHIPYKKCKATL